MRHSYFFFLGRSTHATVSTVTSLLPTQTTNLRCGPRIGVDGESLGSFTLPKIAFNSSLSCISSGTTRFLGFGEPTPYRPVEDLAFAVARFFQRGGTFQNYYMVIN